MIRTSAKWLGKQPCFLTVGTSSQAREREKDGEWERERARENKREKDREKFKWERHNLARHMASVEPQLVLSSISWCLFHFSAPESHFTEWCTALCVCMLKSPFKDWSLSSCTVIRAIEKFAPAEFPSSGSRWERWQPPLRIKQKASYWSLLPDEFARRARLDSRDLKTKQRTLGH